VGWSSVEGGGEGHPVGEMIFKILIPRVFASFIFNFFLIKAKSIKLL
jgi:hypothetical protein